MKQAILGSALSLLLAGIPSIVSAQSACYDYNTLRSAMTASGVRLSGSGQMEIGGGVFSTIEVWVAPDQKWALLGIGNNGVACILLSGEGWSIPEKV